MRRWRGGGGGSDRRVAGGGEGPGAELILALLSVDDQTSVEVEGGQVFVIVLLHCQCNLT